MLRVHHERASIIFQALLDGSRKLASTPPNRATRSCMNSTPFASRDHLLLLPLKLCPFHA